jgi:NADPH:quinone reductase-like Zn-dependent oxidoreductase
VDDRKLAWAKDFGATHTVNSRNEDPVEAIRALTGGNGADVVIEQVSTGMSRRFAARRGCSLATLINGHKNTNAKPAYALAA